MQEVSETIYHVLWELVHVFFERDDAQALFAYLPQASGAQPVNDLLAEVQASTLQKARDVCALRTEMQTTAMVHVSLRPAAPLLTASGARDGSSPLAMGAAQQMPRTRPPIVSSHPIARGNGSRRLLLPTMWAS